MAELLTLDQVAEYLDLATDAVEQYALEHGLRVRTLNGQKRVSGRDFDRFILSPMNEHRLTRAIVKRALAIADRNPGLSSDDILDELERMDEEMKRSRTAS